MARKLVGWELLVRVVSCGDTPAQTLFVNESLQQLVAIRKRNHLLMILPPHHPTSHIQSHQSHQSQPSKSIPCLAHQLKHQHPPPSLLRFVAATSSVETVRWASFFQKPQTAQPNGAGHLLALLLPLPSILHCSKVDWLQTPSCWKPQRRFPMAPNCLSLHC